jgi:hypothetical protein
MKNAYSPALQTLLLASYLIADHKEAEASLLLDAIEPADDITRICVQSLRGQNQLTAPLYVATPQTEDKQINVFDLVLQSVPPVEQVSRRALGRMLELYAGLDSFTHLNIGIGKGRFEVKMLETLAVTAPHLPRLIRIVGIDVDAQSLDEAGREIRATAGRLLPATTRVEYVSICAFAEAIDPSIWDGIREHHTDLLGVISAFTLHHIPTAEKRSAVIRQVAACNPELFVLLEPDADHFTEHLPARLMNCFQLFEGIFRQVDQNKLSPAEAQAIKYTFFGREIQDILSLREEKRSEKHERADVWAGRLQEAGFRLQPVDAPGGRKSRSRTKDRLRMVQDPHRRYTTTEFEGVPMVAMLTAGRS